jgi:hypothetical protein
MPAAQTLTRGAADSRGSSFVKSRISQKSATGTNGPLSRPLVLALQLPQSLPQGRDPFLPGMLQAEHAGHLRDLLVGGSLCCAAATSFA